jgi:Ca2+:H+ antiporter
MYVASLVFSLVTHTEMLGAATEHEAEEPEWSARQAVILLAVAGLLVGLMSELLVGALEHTVSSLHLSELWVGLILVPIVGNAAEHSSAVVLAMKNKMDVSLDIAIGSSAQIALFVTPVLVFAGLIFGHDLTLQFSVFEVGAIALAVAAVAIMALDGRTNWLEGAQLLGVYTILAVTSFFLGKA